MSQLLPQLYLVRHGETDWSASHRHTGRTDIPLNAHGEAMAKLLAERLRGLRFDHVFTSPLRRARRTCELAGLAATAQVDPDLLEWDYGAFEGRVTADIERERPGWDLFRDGGPGGELPNDVGVRADRFLTRDRQIDGSVIAFASGHIIRVIAARWLGLPPSGGRYLFCSTASIGILGYEHDLTDPVLRRWNDDGALT